MIRTILLTLLLIFCSAKVAGQTPGTSLAAAIELGTYSESFVYTGYFNMEEFPDNYSCDEISYWQSGAVNDIFFKLVWNVRCRWISVTMGVRFLPFIFMCWMLPVRNSSTCTDILNIFPVKLSF